MCLCVKRANKFIYCRVCNDNEIAKDIKQKLKQEFEIKNDVLELNLSKICKKV